MIKSFELEPGVPAHRIEHNLNTTALLVNVWQNDHTVAPSVRVVDENHVEVYNMFGGGSIVIAAADPEANKSSKEKVSSSGQRKSSTKGGETSSRKRSQGSSAD